MNLANTFARIRALFRRTFTRGVLLRRNKSTEIRFIDVSEHLRRDLGYYNGDSKRRVHEDHPRSETFVVYGPLRRGP
jgi:hypothetical protein